MTQLSLADRVISHVCDNYQLSGDSVVTMLPTFITVLQDHMGNMENALEIGEPGAIGRRAHTLKGALLNLGLGDIAEIAETIEKEGKVGNKDMNYAELVVQLTKRMEEIL